MTRTLLLIGILFATTAAHPQAGSPIQQPIRNSFATAAESLIDQATSLDLHAPPEVFDAEMSNLKTSRANLEKLADSDREHTLASSIDDLLFAISSCRIQAIDNADTTACQARITRARTRVLEVLNKHKSGVQWLDGPA